MQQLISFDESVAAHFYSWIASSTLLSKVFVILGVGLVYLVPLLLLVVWFIVSRKVALKAFVAGILAWEGLAKLVAKLLPRPRPSMSSIGVKELVFHRPDTSFPSDHSAFLMAVAVTFYLNDQKKLGHFVLALAILTGFARVGIGVHFPGDILAGWIVGLITALLIKAIDQPLDQWLAEPIIKLARRFKL